ncbi:MAG: hypothetical protein JO030_00770 [Candidatus Eremiobacteraeota bacterium]|nr:hypothetical protein [Candidatus Eremiobacteraeota bacterium]
MERDDFREAWASLQPDAAMQEAIERALSRQAGIKAAHTALQRDRGQLSLEVALNYAAVIALGAFAVHHAMHVTYMLCAALLGSGLLAVNLELLRIAMALRRLDYGQPVFALQSSIEAIRTRRARLTAIILALAPLAWTPLLVVAVAIFGGDAIATLGTAYIAANAAFSLAFALAAWLGARRFGRHVAHSGWLRGLTDALSGQAYREALERLTSLERFRDVA